MYLSSNSQNPSSSWVGRLVVINVIFFILQIVIASLFSFRIESYLGLIPQKVVSDFWIWQLFSYMFLHSPQNILHILFNMYLLWIFGIAIEEEWGGKEFLKYYLFSGVGAGISILILNYFQVPWSLTIGASGAIYALLLAFGIIYPNAEILLFFIIPMKAKYAVLLFGSFEFFMTLSATGSHISHIGHLGGIIFGLLYFLLFKKKYIFPKQSSNQGTAEIIGEIRKKVDEIKEKAEQQTRKEVTKTASDIKTKIESEGEHSLTLTEKKFLESLEKSVAEDKRQNICEVYDFDSEDSYCQSCNYYNLCLHRDTTGKDPLKE